nr:immunoglobulin light chain junction region [Mus musculus]NSM03248.1 immunoglobulin light chain junction region [Mus musculus]NSM03257.1 immunoglobulin light chain junction region [Mus musculus]NSM03285.1 immunoglobulin light chain junction region [Mus musculus]NSM03286.1 immunoglobulin light chain junction region [Mus musculus]
CALWYSNHFVF